MTAHRERDQHEKPPGLELLCCVHNRTRNKQPLIVPSQLPSQIVALHSVAHERATTRLTYFAAVTKPTFTRSITAASTRGQGCALREGLVACGGVSCGQVTRSASPMHARSTASSCVAMQGFAVRTSAGRGRRYSRSNPPRNWRPVSDVPSAQRLTNFPANITHRRSRSQCSSACVSRRGSEGA